MWWVKSSPDQIPCRDSRSLLYFTALPSGSHLTRKPPEGASNKHPIAASPFGLKALGMRLHSFSKRQEKESPKCNEQVPVSVAWLGASPANPSGKKGLLEVPPLCR